MMSDKLVSVIIPAYNAEKYLDRCLKSVANQTYQNLEIILIDDGSQDNTPQICDQWSLADNRIIVLHIANNGVANARNQALDIVRGDYIAFVDSDDWVEPDYIEKLKDTLEQINADIAICTYQINNEPRCYAEPEVLSYDDTIRQICMGTYLYGVLWNKLYKREVVNQVRMPHYECCEDLVFNYYVLKNASVIGFVNENLYHYFQNSESTVHGSFKIGAFDAVFSKENILQDARGTIYEEYAVCGLVKSVFVVLSGCIKNNMFMEKYGYLRQYVLKYKDDILNKSYYSKNHKLRTLLLIASPKLYNLLVRLKG